ncbi:CHAT domain-containing protein [Frankia sp. Cas4]|uniref:CHAT domain-containing protein n=1 Tax=Frankia sp. Cas4 TaxID=3073927 RepID=UPI002AD3E189|nr:CHAT domain-containing protein [Frankia sp. Cas4]
MTYHQSLSQARLLFERARASGDVPDHLAAADLALRATRAAEDDLQRAVAGLLEAEIALAVADALGELGAESAMSAARSRLEVIDLSALPGEQRAGIAERVAELLTACGAPPAPMAAPFGSHMVDLANEVLAFEELREALAAPPTTADEASMVIVAASMLFIPLASAPAGESIEGPLAALINSVEAALAFPLESTVRTLGLLTVGNALLRRCELRGDIADADAAVEVGRSLVDGREELSPANAVDALGLLGNALFRRAVAAGDASGICESVPILEAAADLAADLAADIPDTSLIARHNHLNAALARDLATGDDAEHRRTFESVRRLITQHSSTPDVRFEMQLDSVRHYHRVHGRVQVDGIECPCLAQTPRPLRPSAPAGDTLGHIQQTAMHALSTLAALSDDPDDLERHQAKRAVSAAIDAMGEYSSIGNWLTFHVVAMALAFADHEPEAALHHLRRGMRGPAWRVFTQPTPGLAVRSARAASHESDRAIAFCLSIGGDCGLYALEAGRTLVLQAATASRALGELLQAEGAAELAAQWEEHRIRWLSAPVSDEVVPDDLRQRIAAALADSDLVEPPRTADVQAAMTELGIDAVAYVLLATPFTEGGFLTLRRTGEPVFIEVPEMRPDQPALRSHLAGQAAALDAVCDWAGECLQPLLRHLGIDLAEIPDPPVVCALVPVGVAGAVPWHAGRWAAEGGLRYAVQAAEFTYAASAGMICTAAARTVDPGDHSLIIANPTRDLLFAEQEAMALRADFYRTGTYLGYPKALASRGLEATPQTVLAELFDASTPPGRVVFACHGSTGSDPTKSGLWLAGSARLSVHDLLRRAAGRPAAGKGIGPFVFLSACTTDATDADHDEVLTLATAFLSAGAASVIGSLWPIDDEASAVLSYMVHHFVSEGTPVRQALRAAQLWMVDPDRAVPDDLAGRQEFDDAVGSEELAEPRYWAGFAHRGR